MRLARLQANVVPVQLVFMTNIQCSAGQLQLVAMHCHAVPCGDSACALLADHHDVVCNVCHMALLAGVELQRVKVPARFSHDAVSSAPSHHHS